MYAGATNEFGYYSHDKTSNRLSSTHWLQVCRNGNETSVKYGPFTT